MSPVYSSISFIHPSIHRCVVWSLAIYGVIHYYDNQKEDGSSGSSSTTDGDDTGMYVCMYV